MTLNTGRMIDIQDEHIILQQRVAALEQENAQLQQRVKHLEHDESLNQDYRFFVRGPIVFFTWVCADGWPVEYVSSNVAQLLGYQDDDFTSGRVPYSSLVHPDDLERVVAEVQLYSEQGRETFKQDYRLISASGDICWIYDFTVVQRNAEGTITHYYGYILDITDRKRGEEQLRQSQTLLQAIIDALPQAIFWKDHNSVYEGCNRVFATAAGCEDPRDIVGKTDDNLPWKLDKAEFAHQIDQRVMEHDIAEYNIVELQVQANGNQRWLNMNKIPLHDISGNVTGILGSFEDITERKQQEEDLSIFKAVVENAVDGIGMVNNEGCITYANASYGALTGYGQTLIGRALDTLYEVDMAKIQTIMQNVAEQGYWLGGLLLRHRNGTILPVHLSVFPVHNEQDCMLGTVAIIRDMREQQHAEAERTALQQQVIDAQQIIIRELSSPLLPITTSTIALPLIGTIDTVRIQQIMETLLQGIATHHASIAILDITGVNMVDTQVAQALIQMAQAARLLGAEVVLTGIQPQIAQTLIRLDVDLQGIVTRSTLQDGISYALNGRKSKWP